MLLNEFVNLYGGLSGEDFLLRFDHPFLLEAAGDDSGRRREIFLLQGDEGVPLVVGRGIRCHIRIRDSLVSTRHAELTLAGAHWQLTDKGSTNKTRVMDKVLTPEEPVTLADGDRVSLGLNSHLIFLAAESVRAQLPRLSDPASSDEDDAPTDLLDPAIRKALEEDATEAGARGKRRFPIPADQDALKTLVSPGHDDDEDALVDEIMKAAPKRTTGKQRPVARPVLGELLLFCDTHDPVPIRSGKRVVVGRSPSAQITVPSKEVSRAHAEFERRTDGVYVRDLGSANGTFLGKIKVRGGWLRVPPGKAVTISSYRIMIGRPQLQDSSEIQLPAAATSLETLDDVAPEGSYVELGKDSVADLVQKIEEERATGVLRIRCGTLKGQITFQDGHPHQAGTNKGDSAEAAIRKLLKLEGGTCAYSAGGKIGRKTISRTFSEIILEEFLTDG